ncbi:unnamed protein product [Caenorhabditis auriculariae]|uniref:Uncharacterized protein n=1 Tax=Caenorhabditis auriculariae TaxID=2777116 RepID=A0A8S1HTC8_9PELO|nr:unnamed protein product [Caenorhabditis auriculariae]
MLVKGSSKDLLRFSLVDKLSASWPDLLACSAQSVLRERLGVWVSVEGRVDRSPVIPIDFPMLLVVVAVVVGLASCHCPHMMKMAQTEGPSAPAPLPEGDEGWDYDVTGSAPGILPDEHFIQTTHVYRTTSQSAKKSFSAQVVEIMRELRERLSKAARLTLENENIECEKVTDHFRCEEFPAIGSFNYLVVEDSKRGAIIYDVDRKLNDRNLGTIEMALLDALSRHSPHPLTRFASRDAEREVGFIRALSAKETEALAKPPSSDTTMEKFSPLELNLIDPALLEIRSGEGLDSVEHDLTEFKTQKEFDDALSSNKFVFVLFWNNVQMTSLHMYNLLARVSKQVNRDEVLLGQVSCHKRAEFCQGLKANDFYTLVAYRNGKNIGSTHKISDEQYYLSWIELMKEGPLLQLHDDSEWGAAKKGQLLSRNRQSVTIGVFPDKEDIAFKHFQIVAEKLAGSYYLAYLIKDGQKPKISTYRSMERQKRVAYDGRFDPASLTSFISRSSLPSVIDISDGFTTDVLLRQRRPVALLVAEKSFDDGVFQKVASRQEVRKNFVFAQLQRDSDQTKEVLLKLKLHENSEPTLVMINKDRLHYIPLYSISDADEMLKHMQKTRDAEPDQVLPTREPHPLRYLQVKRVNQIFGSQETVVLPDHSLFIDQELLRDRREIVAPKAGGGCPFMQGGGVDLHEEL